MTHSPSWLSWPETQTLISLFAAHPGSLRFVGGAVRDSLLGREVKEVDAATTLLPEEVQKLAAGKKVRSIPTGLAHGTVTLVIAARSFEVTTLRRDIKTDGRHADVAFTDNWKEDAARRDFTMNALYLSPEGELFDYFGGETDARRGIVRFIGEPEKRISEDHLRILRFFRFYAHYSATPPDAAALAACAALAPKLQTLPAERIWQELSKLLAAPRAHRAIQFMHEMGVLANITGFSVHSTNTLRRLEEISEAFSVPVSVSAKLVALAQTATKPVTTTEIASRLRCSVAASERMAIVQKYAQSISSDLSLPAQKKLLRAVGSEPAGEALLLAWARDDDAAIDTTHPYHAMLTFMREWQVPSFPVSGKDLLAQGEQPGKALGDRLAKLEVRWEESDYTLSKEELLKLI